MNKPPVFWVITDTHFLHEDRMCAACNRPSNYTERIIERWSRVLAGDVVIHLGDVIFRKDSQLCAIMQEFSTRNILVRGNHDKHATTWYLERGFDMVVDAFEMNGVYFTHIPSTRLPIGCHTNVCGHVHNNPYDRIITYDPYLEFREWHRVLSLEDMKYAPRLLSEVLGGKWARTDLPLVSSLPIGVVDGACAGPVSPD